MINLDEDEKDGKLPDTPANSRWKHLHTFWKQSFSSNGTYGCPWDTTLHLYCHVPIFIYGLYKAFGGRLREQSARVLSQWLVLPRMTIGRRPPNKKQRYKPVYSMNPLPIVIEDESESKWLSKQKIGCAKKLWIGASSSCVWALVVVFWSPKESHRRVIALRHETSKAYSIFPGSLLFEPADMKDSWLVFSSTHWSNLKMGLTREKINV